MSNSPDAQHPFSGIDSRALVPARPVEVIIACHAISRPVGRAVASVLDDNGEHASCTVVCHNLSCEEVRSALRPEHRDLVRLHEHWDAYQSASGPFNAGIDRATAEFVAIMGSDDRIAPGAVASWLRVQKRTEADFVITRLALGDPNNGVPTPAVRMHRGGLVTLTADRLSYRSAPLGLMRRTMLERTGIRLVEGAPVGGDVAMVTQLMAEQATAYDRFGPPYVIGEDAGDRVTLAIRPMSEQLGFFAGLLTAAWFRRLDRVAKAAIGSKLLRIHVFGAVFYRDEPAIWTDVERRALADAARDVLGAAPGCENPLSRADRELLDVCLDPTVPAEELIAKADRRRHHGLPSTLLTRNLTHLLHREAPIRFMAASLAVKMLPRIRRG